LAFLSPYRATLEVVQIILAIALIVAILLQPRGSGLGSVFGGSGTVFKTRRGVERLLFRGTIFIAIAFFLLSFLNASIP
jgi:preprotein translocase subunit SecG